MFNAETFLQSQTESALSTVRLPVPAGEYPGSITKIDFRQAEDKKEAGKYWTFCDITWDLQVPQNVKDELGREKVTSRQSMFIDLNAQGTGLDFSKGKNVGLGRVRAAVGQNQDGKPWSPAMLIGAAAKVKIKHRMNGEDVLDEVDTVSPL